MVLGSCAEKQHRALAEHPLGAQVHWRHLSWNVCFYVQLGKGDKCDANATTTAATV